MGPCHDIIMYKGVKLPWIFPSYPGYFREPHWISMGLPEISRVTLTGMHCMSIALWRAPRSLRSVPGSLVCMVHMVIHNTPLYVCGDSGGQAKADLQWHQVICQLLVIWLVIQWIKQLGSQLHYHTLNKKSHDRNLFMMPWIKKPISKTLMTQFKDTSRVQMMDIWSRKCFTKILWILLSFLSWRKWVHWPRN